ncbi:glycoside hydrolase family 130 protein [Sphingobacterium sp. SRCM116780]|uniref:glycoside hydrolase family 130 protein n=1 Tax=Sphingobacterium sp. SRCM116780 TaxID=2907623 RepID=UPI001F3BBF10|nr:glycoside hydrolase family 130 protein [Sphingobacterium sp. SRCM116780]UIR54983.1 glycoside hydrolase family 130 protein [Sphingobacterium sp. SRCM116780]
MMKNLKLLPFFFLALTLSCKHQKDENKQIVPDWTLGGFTRPEKVNPIIEPDSTASFLDPMSGKMVRWEENDTFNPGAVVKDGKVCLLYRAEDKFGVGIGFRTSRLGLASSLDGIHFERSKTPVLYPDNDAQKSYEWPGGVEDPRLAVTEDGTYVVIYTQWNRDVPRLGIATSKDLVTWKKHGPIFKNAHYTKLVDTPHKSASILTTVKNDRLVITKWKGKYWMYWGEHGVSGATSENLVDWEPILDDKGEIAKFIMPRPGFFDSELTECGPPAILTDKGILLLYNGKNHKKQGDKRFTLGTYSAGQVLFDKNDPTRVLKRLDVPFMRPMEDFEKSGQYVDGTVFIQGLVYFHSKWFLYYGCADSKVGVSVFDPTDSTAFDPLPSSYGK